MAILSLTLTASRTVAVAVKLFKSYEMGRMGRIDIGSGDDFLFLRGAGFSALQIHQSIEVLSIHDHPRSRAINSVKSRGNP